jgi:ATP-dependent DNA helicase DinG
VTAGEPRLGLRAADAIRAAVRLAGGREVCFVGTVDGEGIVQGARAVARGDARSVLALPGFAKRGELLVHNHPSGSLEPSGADLDVAARLHDDGIGFAIVDNEATRLYVVVEVPRREPEHPLDGDAIAGLLDAHGPVAAHMGRFEDRPTQREMAATIATLYTTGGIGMLEAATGVGKSLAYLVPALRWAAANGERTVVSTNTIALQEQLIGKDLPILAEALTDQKVRFALLKGWHNYLCKLRLETARAEGASLFEDATAEEFHVLDAWAAKTRDGSLADLAVQPRREVWDEVAAEGDLCTRLRCPHFDSCFVFMARRKAAEADVVVVNHHLLMADVAVRRASGNWSEAAVLPPFTRLVIDEGHHLEDAAAAHLGHTVSRRGLLRLFARLERRGKGLLPARLDGFVGDAARPRARAAVRQHPRRARQVAGGERPARRVADRQERGAGPPHRRLRRRPDLAPGARRRARRPAARNRHARRGTAHGWRTPRHRQGARRRACAAARRDPWRVAAPAGRGRRAARRAALRA